MSGLYDIQTETSILHMNSKFNSWEQMGCRPGFFAISSSINVNILLYWRHFSVYVRERREELIVCIDNVPAKNI